MRFAMYHPVILLLYFFSMTIFICVFQHPVFLAISFFFSFLYSLYCRRDENGHMKSDVIKSGILQLIGSVAFSGLFTVYYAYGHHFGVTSLVKNSSGNYITLESIAYGAAISLRVCSMLLWLKCIHRIFTTDKIVYLFGKIHPKMSLYIAIGLRMGPRTVDKGRIINEAQCTIGKGINQGSVLERIKHLIRLCSILLSWTTEQWKESGDSMRSRGYTLKGRTAFSIYRFNNRDRTLVVWIVLLLTIVCAGGSLNQNTVTYNPEIVLQRITVVSCLFYGAYVLLFLLPFGIELICTGNKNKI